ncbi:hypothetical protein GUJ93_ZPchr0011g27948 [Zizania palustris]|uniref:Uncharacterized protein n=1 Tax=Zizania palustris TaxID=103762 RepID=A0A8J5WI02_ZIZPA|nr:hypothetical protein GUJ93_ZPchr0011g27948 [Zizania palustris]
MDSLDYHSWIEPGSNLYVENNVTTLRKEPSAHDDPNEEEIGDNREEDNTEINEGWSSLRIENEDVYGFGLLDEDTVFMTMIRNNKYKSELGRKKTRNDAEASTSSVGNPTTTSRRWSGHALAGSPALGVAPRRRSAPPRAPPALVATASYSRQRSAPSRAPPALVAATSCSRQRSAPSRAPPSLAATASCSRHRDEAASVLTSLRPASVPIQSHCRTFSSLLFTGKRVYPRVYGTRG